MKLDDKDKAICTYLMHNGRASVSEIARNTKLPRDSVHYRLQRLIKNGVISMFHTFLDYRKLGYPIYVYVNIELHNLSEEDEKKFHNYLMESRFVAHIAKLTGRYDYLLGIAAKDLPHFDKIVKDIRKKHAHIIKDYTTATIIEEYKYDCFAPLIE